MQALSLDKAKFIIAKARAYDAEVAPVDEDSGSNPSDDRGVDVLQGGADNCTGQELRDTLGALNFGERNELVALIWVGRGDYTGGEWATAVAEASRYATNRVDYLMRQPMLGDLIEEGLAELGYSLEELADIGAATPAKRRDTSAHPEHG